jgi:hypothetical protein
MLNFEQFLNIVDMNYHENEFEVRYGQTIMNVLHRVWPEKYKELTNTDYDCFYDDGTAENTLSKLEQDWSLLDGQI